MTVNWTNGNGSKRIVKINTSNSFANPANGDNPTADNSWNGTGEQVIFNGTGSSVTITALSPTTTYWYRVYEYNEGGTGSVLSLIHI